MDIAAVTGNAWALDISDSPVITDVLRFRGTEALSRPFSWRIEFTTPQSNILPEQVLMKYASFSMRDSKVVHGIITSLEWHSTNADESHYSITLESRLALLSRSRRCALYQNLSVPDVVEQVLRAHGMEGADFEFTLSHQYPVRELITQWRETDLEFIQRILSEVGIWFRQTMDEVTGLDVTVFGYSQLHYAFHAALPYHEPSGLHDGAELCCWGLRSWHNVVPGKVSTRDYNPRSAAEPMDTAVSVRSPALTTGEHYRYAEPYREAGDDTLSEPEAESGAFYARLHHERELNNASRVHLFSNAFWLTPGMVFEPQGLNLQNLRDGVIITFTSFIGSRDSRLHVSVWGMPYREEYCFRPVAIARPEIHGTLPGRVESRSPHDTYAHLDEQGRYRVRLDFNLEDCEPGYAYPWLRMAKPFTGDTYGWHIPLIDGTEVAIAYSNGDPDLPYISHAFHNSEHLDVVNRDNRSQNILRTASRNELRMEDKRGAEHIAFTTEFATSQLNQGHITDAQENPRGQGFELRTDERGAIRVAKGLFISADGQQKAAGEVLDRETALTEIDQLQQQLQQLEIAAEQAQALKADVDNQIRMFTERLQPLNEALLFSAPEGMAFTSGEHLQLAASKNVAINGRGDISVGAMGNMTALAGDKIGLFARSGQLSLKSAEGPVEIQAQNDAMRLFAQKKLSISAAEDISFTGKKRITLIGGGSYLKLEQRRVEYGTTGVYLRRVKRTMVAAAQSMPMTFPRTGTPYIYSAIYQLQDKHGNILVNTPYRLTTPSGQTATGYSDNEGNSVPVYTRQQEEVELHVLTKTPQPEEAMWFLGETDMQQLETELRENPS
ncbi:type VI secretion system Vgr family protein [Salmonella enterica]